MTYSNLLGRSRKPPPEKPRSATSIAEPTGAPSTTDEIVATRPPSRRAQFREAVALLAVLVVALLLLSAYFTDRQGGVDEAGLFNPSYVDLHYGQVAYPIYHDFSGMVVHPPFQYKIIGTLMRWGFSYYYAEGTPTFLMSLIGVALIVWGPFEAPIKIGLLCGLVSAIAVFVNVGSELFGMRPEGHLNAAWMTGLIALESGRLLKWSWKWLCAGPSWFRMHPVCTTMPLRRY